MLKRNSLDRWGGTEPAVKPVASFLATRASAFRVQGRSARSGRDALELLQSASLYLRRLPAGQLITGPCDVKEMRHNAGLSASPLNGVPP